MTLGTLLNLYVNGALKVDYSTGSCVANVGGVTLGIEQANALCNSLGWVEFYLNPFEIIQKTGKFIASLKRGKLSTEWTKEMWDNTTVSFQNFRSNTYGKTYDRIVLTHPYNFNYVIIYGMPGQGASYVVYENGKTAPVAKCRNLNKVAEFILGQEQD